MKRLMMLLVGLAASVVWAAESEPRYEAYDDTATNLAFPSEIAGMWMNERSVYGPDDYSLNYVSREFVEKLPGGRSITIYVFSREGEKLPGDGISGPVRRELADAVGAVLARKGTSMVEVIVKNKETPVAIGAQQGVVANLEYRSMTSNYEMRGDVLVTGFHGKFIKIRSTEEKIEGKTLNSRWNEIVATVGKLMDQARTERARDIYAIANPTQALAAVQAKWRGAADRVSAWKMPKLAGKRSQIDDFMVWCAQDNVKRAPRAELACEDAVSMKVEPPFWYYNLACARALQGKKEKAFEALEQAVAAGYGTEENAAANAWQDADLASITNDVRFAKLCAMMAADSRVLWDFPKKLAMEERNYIRLTDDNVAYRFDDESYLVCLSTDNKCPVVYVNHHGGKHPDIPDDGLISIAYPEEARKAGVDVGAANIHFLNHRQSQASDEDSWCPTVVAGGEVGDQDRLNRATSLPARLGEDGRKEFRHLFLWNVLGVYSAASDYWCDGIDRFIGWFPGSIAHAGGAEESDKFVRLFADIVRALPPKARNDAALHALHLIRHGQKCVKSEDDFMSGRAQRPVLRFADIDVPKVLAAAAKVSPDELAMFSPMLNPKKTRPLGLLPVTDLWEAPYDRPCLAKSGCHVAFVARGGESTFRYAVACCPRKNGKLIWKVLQGDEKKVRIVPKTEDSSEIELEVDYHTVFEVPLADGSKIKTSRVDVGCFLVENGVASMPMIASVYFMPNETREYGQDGKLLSIDYAKRQLDGYCPRMCPKGDWKDVFHWNDAGELTGWTRLYSDSKRGTVTTNEFTREGLLVDSRDALGRPQDVHRSLNATFFQELNPTNLEGEARHVMMGWQGHEYDAKEGDQLGMTLAWQYTYQNDADRFGKPSPKNPKPFAYRPELCRRADFTDPSTGFRLPLVDQVELGYEIYAGYKHDVVGQFASDFKREDSALALKDKGLVPPKVLKKMKFCKWTPSTNDAWKVESKLAELLKDNKLWELADGVYRFERVSVRDTYKTFNDVGEMSAYLELDENYRRCTAEEIRRTFGGGENEETFIVEGDYVNDDYLPSGKCQTVTAWQMADGLYFVIIANRREWGKRLRNYFFGRVDKTTGEGSVVASFRELPSLAIGNTVLAAERGDPDALNNLAVLLYAEIADEGEYDEKRVVSLLRRAAKLGNATAAYNLGVLAENRGEKGKENNTAAR